MQGFENGVFSKGQDIASVVNLFGWNVSIALGSDLQYPEYFRMLQKKHVNIVLVPGAYATMTADETNVISELYAQTRAREFSMHILYANYYQQDDAVFKFFGKSSIASPVMPYLRLAPSTSAFFYTTELSFVPNNGPDANANFLLGEVYESMLVKENVNYVNTIISGILFVLALVLFLLSIAVLLFAAIYANKQSRAGIKGTDEKYENFIAK